MQRSSLASGVSVRALRGAVAAGLFVWVCGAWAQTSAATGTGTDDQPFTLSVQAQVVTVPVTVRDSKGHLVQDLTKDDFTLTEQGRQEKIRYLTVDRDRPLTVGLLVDTSGSQKEYIPKERAAANQFLETMLTRPDDTAFLVRFDNATTMLQVPTSSKEKLAAALTHLEDPHDPRLHHPGGTLLYDTLDLTCERVTRQVQGRNAIVVLTDGRDNGSELTLDDVIQAAQVSNTVIYSILYTDEQAAWLSGRTPGALSGKQVLEKLSEETGGHMFQVSRKEPVEAIFASVAEEMRMQYVLAYTPSKQGPGYAFRSIELKGKEKSWKIQTRAGYFYSGPEQPQ